MFVYWGYKDSGKGHMKKYAKINSKTVIYYDDNFIRKIDTRETYIKKTIYYYGKEFVSEVSESNFNPNKNKTKPYLKNGRFDLATREKYGYESLTHDQLSGHYDTIFDGGDIFLMTHLLPEFFIVDNLTRIKSSCNVIPYHTNLERYYIAKLDNFGANRIEEYGNNLFDIWKHDKDRIFKWLDLWEKDFYDIVNRLKKYDIPYQYFDLSKDDYIDTFGWKKELSRSYSYIDEYLTNIDDYKNIIRQYNPREYQLL